MILYTLNPKAHRHTHVATRCQAYARALRAKLNPSAPKSEIDYGIESNPISCIDTLARYQKPRLRYLRDSEFGEVWRRVKAAKKLSIPKRGLQLCILLGGQRAEQVVSVSQIEISKLNRPGF